MLHDLRNLIDEMNIKLIIGYGSKITGEKRGLSKTHDIDLIIVSDNFKSMSRSTRKRLIEKKLEKNYDLILLTVGEFASLRKEKESVVNIALKEGKMLYYVE